MTAASIQASTNRSRTGSTCASAGQPPTPPATRRSAWTFGSRSGSASRRAARDRRCSTTSRATRWPHFRVNYSILDRSLWKGTLHARGGIGFAELQLGKDNPGFNFGGPDADRGSVAGPEAALSAQWLLPMYKKLDFVVTGTAGLAYFTGAPQLATSKSELQSFVSVEAGVGW